MENHIQPTLTEYLLPIAGAVKFVKRTDKIPYQDKVDARVVTSIESGMGKLILAHTGVILTTTSLSYLLYHAIKY